tara:strand:- start:26 stop:184 length:159 start_codon:yes stop_codon:yes gene_type:complete
MGNTNCSTGYSSHEAIDDSDYFDCPSKSDVLMANILLQIRDEETENEKKNKG